MSDAIKGYGATFGREDDTTSGTYNAISEVVSITPPQLSRETVDVTHLNSADEYREFIAGIKDGGEISITMAYLGTANGTEQEKLYGDFESGDVINYQISYPDSATWEAACIVTGIAPAELSNEERITDAVTLKVTGKPTFTRGA